MNNLQRTSQLQRFQTAEQAMYLLTIKAWVSHLDTQLFCYLSNKIYLNDKSRMNHTLIHVSKKGVLANHDGAGNESVTKEKV